MRKFDRIASVFLLAFLGVFPTLLAVPFAVLAVITRKNDERLFSLGTAGLMLLFAALLVTVVPLVMRARNRKPRILSLVEQLQARLGGSAVLPSFIGMLVQPRVITTWGGRELEVRFFRAPKLQRLGSGWPTWQMVVMLAAPTRLRMALLAPHTALALRAGIVGLVPVPTRPLRGGLTVLAERSQEAAHLLAEPGLLDRLEVLGLVPGALGVHLSPASALSLGASYRGVPGDDLTAETVVWIVQCLGEISDAVRARGG